MKIIKFIKNKKRKCLQEGHGWPPCCKIQMDTFKFLSNLTSLWHLVSLTTSSFLKMSLSLGFTMLILSLFSPYLSRYFFCENVYSWIICFHWHIAILQCWFLLCKEGNQLYGNVYIPSPLALLPTLPIPPSWVVSEHSWAPRIHDGSLLALSFRHTQSHPPSSSHPPRPPPPRP